MGNSALTFVIVAAAIIAVLALSAFAAALNIAIKQRKAKRQEAERQPQYRRTRNAGTGAVIDEEPVSRRAAIIAEQVNLLVKQASVPGSRVRAVVSSPSGMGRNASLVESLARYAPGRHVLVPAEGFLGEHSVISWLSDHIAELSSADVIAVDGMLTRGPGERSVSETLVRLLSGHAIQVPRKYEASFELRLKEGFSLVLSETDRNAQWASSVIAALAPKSVATKELWL